MTFFKSTGRGLGCRFNEKEKKAIELEARKQLAEWTRQHTNEFDAMFLWFMHEEFGFGHERLKKIYFDFAPRMRELIERYEMRACDSPYLCTQKLLEYGIDISEWEKEADKAVEN